MQAVGFQRVDMKAELEEYFTFRMMCELEHCMTNELALTSVTDWMPEAIETMELYKKISAEFLQNMEINKQ